MIKSERNRPRPVLPPSPQRVVREGRMPPTTEYVGKGDDNLERVMFWGVVTTHLIAAMLGWFIATYS